MLSNVQLVLLLLVATTLLAVAAQRLKLAYPIVLVLGGAALGLIPGLPHIALDPQLAFDLFLPPLLFYGALFMPWPDFKANLRPILLLAVGLVGATTVAVAYTAWATIGLPLAVGFVLGAIVSPPDAIAATAIARRLGLPHRLVVVLEGESLINDAAGLVLFRFALAAVVTGTFSAPAAGLEFVRVAAGGAGLGLAVAWLARQLFRRLRDSEIVTALSLLLPFAIYLSAELLGFSGVLATVAAGIYLGWHAPTLLTPEARVRASAVWDTLVFLLNGLAFILIGLQLPFIQAEMAREPPGLLLAGALAVIGVVVAVRALWVFGTSALAELLVPRLRREDPVPWQTLAVVSWAGMRGIVSLAAALALPETVASGVPFPHRGLVLFLAFCVILATLVLQGLSLPKLVSSLGFAPTSAEAERRKARRLTLGAALTRLDQLAGRDDLPVDVLAHLRQGCQYALRALDQCDEAIGDIETHQRLQHELIEAERRLLITMRADGAISADTFREFERMLDLRATWVG